MKFYAIFAALVLCLTGSGTLTVNQTLVSDGQLVAAGLSALVPLLPPQDQIIANAALGVVNAELSDLKQGASPTTVAVLIQGAVTNVAAALGPQLGANQSVVAGIRALEGVASILLADVQAPAPKPAGAPMAALASDPRVALRMWVDAPK